MTGVTWPATCRVYQRPAARAFHLGHDSGHIPRLDLPASPFGTGEASPRTSPLPCCAATRSPTATRSASGRCLRHAAQPLSRVLRLTVNDLDQQPGSPLLLHLGEPPSPVPEPFAGLLLRQTGQAGCTTSTWLFPGRNPGQPLAYATMFNQLRELGFPMRTGRISALRELAATPASPGKRSGPDQARRHWRLGPAACPVRLDAPGAFASDHADGFVQRGAHVVQADAVLGRIPAR